DVSLADMYRYLDERLPWIRPTDTGRSTNCLINKLGIYVHTKTLGYSNYAFPYSWDVRVGHKEREMAIEEINEPIDLAEVQQMMREIGYLEPQRPAQELVAFYVADRDISADSLRTYLLDQLPDYMIPLHFYRLTELPLSANGKVDYSSLRQLFVAEVAGTPYAAPASQLEELLVEVWQEVLASDRIGIDDNFLELGGTSLTAIRLTTRLNEMLELDLPLSLVFQAPTIRAYALEVEKILEKLLAGFEDQ
ncbi:MAG: hypothetical protein D6772_10010, partial [Bacteroidetes bacterium]